MLPVFYLILSNFFNSRLKYRSWKWCIHIEYTVTVNSILLQTSNKHHLSANLLEEFTILFLLQNGINMMGYFQGKTETNFFFYATKGFTWRNAKY